jgi:Holliday junction DNA helicase RuvB
MIETDKLAAKAVSAERIISASPASPNEEAF